MKWWQSLIVIACLAGCGWFCVVVFFSQDADDAVQPTVPISVGENEVATASTPDSAPPATRTPKPIPPYQSILIKDVPHVLQEPDFCGEACVAMVSQKLGKLVSQRDVFNQSELDPVEGRGCYTRELITAATRIGFQTGPVWYTVDATDAAEQMEEAFRAMHADLLLGVPSIVCMHYDASPDTTEHFRLILGYDQQTDEVIYHEPAIRGGRYQRMRRDDFLALWPLKYSDQKWTLIRLRLEPGDLVDIPRQSGFTDADYAQHIMRLKQKLPSDSFHIVLERPFVVVGDESPTAVEQWASGTIHWATSRVKKQYFAKDPLHIVDIWLFKDKASYDSHTEEIFHTKPGTPFGYYSSRHRALVMNISTGGGTLVHEIVHPFIESNFPQCPSWFNEGLASLYEQCGDRNGTIWGFTNWRLRGLQGVIADEEGEGLPSFQELCETTSYEFYEGDRGDNYAQARYLCYYLQQQGKLAKYYHAFREATDEDPTGYQTLVEVLGEDDMKLFQKKWQEFVMSLKF